MKKVSLAMVIFLVMGLLGVLAASTEESKVLEQINAAANTQQIQEIITENEQLLGLDLQDFNSLSAVQQTSVCEELVGQAFDSVDGLSQVFSENVSTALLGYIVNGIEITDPDGLALTSLPQDQSVYIYMSVTKNSDTVDNPVFILGVYSAENVLKHIFIFKQRYMQQYQTLVFGAQARVNGTDYAKAFAWDSLSGENILSNSVSKAVSDYATLLPEPEPEDTMAVRGVISEIYGDFDQDSVKMQLTQKRINGFWTASDEEMLVQKGGYAVDSLLGYPVETTLNHILTQPVFGAAPQSTGGSAVTFDADFISSVSGSSVSVYQDGGKVTYALNVDKVYYNNVLRTDISVSNLASYSDAEITLVRNRTDSSAYNAVFINQYTEFVVDSVGLSQSFVVSEDLVKYILDGSLDGVNIEFIKNGEEASFEQISEGDVLSILGVLDADNKLIYGKVYITSETVTGTVLAINQDSETVTIDQTVYSYSSSIAEKIVNHDIRVGDTLIFYKNSRGMLVAFDSYSNAKLGFATVVAKSTGIEDVYQIRLMDTQGVWNVLDFASKVYFNGGNSSYDTKTMWGSTWSSCIGTIGNSTETNQYGSYSYRYYINKVVAYELNSSGQISKMYFIPTANSKDVFNAMMLTSVVYDKSSNALGSVQVSDKTIVFSTNRDEIPTDSEVDDDDVLIGTVSELIDREEYSSVASYNLDKNLTASVIWGNNLLGTIYWAADLTVISNKILTTDAKGADGYLFTGIQSGQEVSFFVPDDADMWKADYSSDYSLNQTPISNNMISKGDVVLYVKINNEVSTLYVLADASDIVKPKGTAGLTSTNSFISPTTGVNVFNKSSAKIYDFASGAYDYQYWFGYVYQADSSRIVLAQNASDAEDIMNGSSTGVNLVVTEGTHFTLYDGFYGSISAPGMTRAAGLGDITFDKTGAYDGDMVFVKTKNDTMVEDVVIYKAFS